MIKKITALLLSLLLLGTLVSAQAADYTGIWYLVNIVTNEIAINPADMGMEVTMDLSADGVGTFTSTGEDPTSGTWSLDGDTLTVTVDEEPLSFIMNEEGQLVAEQDGSQMIFGREPAAAGFVPAAEVVAEDVAAFDGSWTITMVNAMGMVVPFAAMAQSGIEGMGNATVEISDGNVKAFDAEAPVQGTLTDGKLVIPSPLGDEFAQTISLLEDGTISVTFMGIVFYCAMTEVAE